MKWGEFSQRIIFCDPLPHFSIIDPQATTLTVTPDLLNAKSIGFDRLWRTTVLLCPDTSHSDRFFYFNRANIPTHTNTL